MQEKLISIIIPVYNVEKYLDECIQSVINQTYKNIEIILVDDGSTDNSSKICDKYAKKDSRIKVIHKENGGVSTARNCGIENSNGEFILFLDSDDILVEDILKQFKEDLKDEADIYTYTFLKMYPDGSLILHDLSKIDSKIYEKNLFLKQFYKKFNGLPWGIQSIFKADIIKENNIRFPKGIKAAEDADFYMSYIKCCNFIKFNNKPIIKYRLYREGSVMTNLKLETICDILSIYSKYAHDTNEIISSIFSNLYVSGLNYIVKAQEVEEIDKILHYIDLDIIKKAKRNKTKNF